MEFVMTLVRTDTLNLLVHALRVNPLAPLALEHPQVIALLVPAADTSQPENAY
jgi:hypothetical protein